MSSSHPAVLVITSLVTRGSVGGRGAVFALERLGHPVWFVPTILLPWHPGQGRGTRITTPSAEFEAFIDDLIASPKLDEIGAVLTGYFASPEAVTATARLVKAVKARKPTSTLSLRSRPRRCPRRWLGRALYCGSNRDRDPRTPSAPGRYHHAEPLRTRLALRRTSDDDG